MNVRLLSTKSPATAQERLLAGLRLLVVVLLVLGIFFRLVNLDKKVYWLDETSTSLRISGYTRDMMEADMLERVRSNDRDARFLTPDDFLRYQRVSSDRNLSDAMQALATRPEHPPLYFLLARFWVQLFGNSVAAIRSLSAVISLFAFPAMYWLAQELFGKTSPAKWIAMGLVAVSPMYLIYAQEARQYTLWGVAILLSSAALLHALRKPSVRGWGIYAVTVALGLYAHLFYVFVALGHAIYTLVRERFRFTRQLLAYGLASLGGIALFGPWLAVIVTSIVRQSIDPPTAFTNDTVYIPGLIRTWVVHFYRLFADFSYGPYYPNANFPDLHLARYIAPLVALFALYAIAFLLWRWWKNRNQFHGSTAEEAPHAPFLVFLLVSITPFALIIPDVFQGGDRSEIPRYLFPFFIGVQLAVTYLFTVKITDWQNHYRQIWQGGLAVFLSAGVLSCVLISPANSWWNKGLDAKMVEVAAMVNQSEKPLFIGNYRGKALMILSYMISDRTTIYIVEEPELPIENMDEYSDVFSIIDIPQTAENAAISKNLVYENAETKLWQFQKQ
ncbi:glycosyltransferase family 39 protein [Geitlerinema sp. PCC 9228]|uniref:glycosyltransferase family 39 protein n=1 Tax=Geitlerinema sp. PCC 9228 TaxID=111611 RepID=UPI0008F9A266|nr:glycosyltransferase family 39 protein [Geitlerinema sp. PCC 9228]